MYQGENISSNTDLYKNYDKFKYALI